MRCLVLFVVLLICPQLTTSEIRPVLINQFPLPHAGFSTLLRSWTLNQTSWSLVVSCFSPLPTATDNVYVIPNIESQLTTNITPTVLTNKINWPNGIVPADRLVEYSIIVPSGFLVPGKTNGNLYFINKDGPTALVPDDGTNWFYHDADFKDMDADGHIDIVAGRAYVPLIGGAQAQLIWLKNPGNETIKGPWKLNYLKTQGGPDIQVQFAEIDSRQVLFANGYFLHHLQMYWSESEPYWNDSSKIFIRHIDYEPLEFAYIQYTLDLNGDEVNDLLVTVNNAFDGSLIVYELPPPGELLNGTFRKHVIASGFKPTTSGRGRGAPGQATPVKFSTTGRKKPVLILSGDDDGCVYKLEAMHDDDPQNWEYDLKVLQNYTGTIGQISVEDVDNDGHPELFVPAYNEGKVYVYRLMDD